MVFCHCDTGLGRQATQFKSLLPDSELIPCAYITELVTLSHSPQCYYLHH